MVIHWLRYEMRFDTQIVLEEKEEKEKKIEKKIREKR